MSVNFHLFAEPPLKVQEVCLFRRERDTHAGPTNARRRRLS